MKLDLQTHFLRGIIEVTKEEILQAIENMTVLELAELVKAMEEKFGVSAAAPVAVAAARLPAVLLRLKRRPSLMSS